MNIITFFTFVFTVTLIPTWAQATGEAPASFTYQGKLFKANGIDAVQDASVDLKLQIRSPDGLCLLFEETHHRDMTGSEGIFSLMAGEGSNSNATNLNLDQVFENVTPKTGAGGCVYTPLAGDTRRIRFSYDNGVEVVSMPTDQTVRSVPYALTASTLQGLSKNQFIQVSSQTTQAKIDVLAGYYSQLVGLATGTSTAFVKASDLPVSGGVLDLSSGGLKVPYLPASGDYAVNKNYADSKVGGLAVDLAGLANGQTLAWNAALSKWQLKSLASADVTTALGYTSLNKAGDTMTGPLNLNSQNLLNTGYITMSPGKYFGLGTYDATAEMNLITNILTPGGTAYAGVTWFSSSSQSVKFWNGTQALSLTSNLVTTAGDVSGVMSALVVSKIQGVAVSNVAPVNNQVLTYNAATSKWEAQTPAAASSALTSLSVSAPLAVVNATSTPAISLQAGTSAGQSLMWNGSAWASAFANVNQLRGVASAQQFPTSCTAAQTMTYSVVTDTYSCANVAIASSQISGLGGAASLSVGTTAGTLAAADDSRLVNAVQISQISSGDVSGTFSNLTVGKIRNVAVSAVAPVNNQVLTYNAATSKWEAQTPAAAAPSVTSLSVSAPLAVVNATSTPAISLQAGTSSGQSLMWNGSAWGSSFANVNQLRGLASAQQFPTSCTAAQTMTYSVVTDTYSCANVAIASSQISGLGGAASLSVGTTTGTLAAGDDSRLVNAVQISHSSSGDVSGTFSNLTVGKIRNVAVSAVVPLGGQVLKYNSVSTQWEASTDATNPGTVTSVTPGVGFTTSTPITSSGTLNINAGTSANQIVQLDSSAKLPAVDGSQLTNMPAVPFTNVVSVTGTSWSVPTAVKKVFVQVWGAGGGGGGGATVGIGGGGGGGGGYAAGFVDVSAVSSVTLVLGAGGSGGAAGGSGTSGGASNFGAISASGGAAGVSAAIAGAAGGSTLAGPITIAGGPGHVGTSAISVLSVVNLFGLGGAGGAAGGGGGLGGSGSLGSASAPVSGTAPGGGGGGGGSGLSGPGASGATGAAGRILVWY